MASKHTILICDDQATIRTSLDEALSEDGHRVLQADSGTSALAILREDKPQLILLDLKLPDMSGVDVLRTLREEGNTIPVILMTAYGDVSTAVEAMKLGAYDFVRKPYRLSEMRAKVTAALKVRDREKAVSARSRGRSSTREGRYFSMLRATPGMQEIVEKIEKVGRSRAGNGVPVLIQAESGTGKELVARAIHEVSNPSSSFMEINCAAVPETLLESELFGHEKGAFTDARSAKEGLFELAGDGTIFLDEIGEMGVTLQSRLLRVIEYGRFRRVGGKADKEVRARIVAATNRKLDRAISEGLFRNDLFYRLQVIEIEIPPLRERIGDIHHLCDTFIHNFNEELGLSCKPCSEALLEVLQSYPWPGNVRELRNMIRRLMILEEPGEITTQLLPEHVMQGVNPRGSDEADVNRIGHELMPLAEVERIQLLHTLEQVGHNKSKAARILGISRQTLREKLKSYGESTPPKDDEKAQAAEA